MRLLIFIFFLNQTLFLFAQTFTGNVIDFNTKQPIEYVSIGVKNKDIGTISNNNGEFKITLSKENIKDSIRFSMIGYESKTYSITDLINRFPNLLCLIYLNKKEIELKEIIIRPKVYKQKVLGNDITSRFGQAGFGNSPLGHEIGTLMKIKSSPCFIEDIKFNVSICDFDSIFFRLNIYKLDVNGEPECILKQPIYIQASKKNIKEDLIIDMKKYNIKVESDFIITIEFDKTLGIGAFYLKANLAGNPTYIKETSQSPWKKYPTGVGISSTVIYEK